jgi:hypothetical protein
MKRVLAVKEANQFFFTQNPLEPPYYYPDTRIQEGDDQNKSAAGSTKESSSPNDENNKEITPRTQAKIDHRLLFGDNDTVPVPCEPGFIR